MGVQMSVAVKGACLAALVMVLASPLSAQWPRHPTPNVPKNTAGQPDMNAPPPKAADGKPDLSGVWRGGGGFGPGRGRGAAADAPPPSGPPVAGFANIGQNIKGGLPLTPYGAELLKMRQAGNSKDNPEAHCLPMGIIQLHTQGAPRKFIQTPREIVILYEASAERREIFIDGRTLPNDDPQPWWNGYSAGRWEGDTLVVETVQFRDGGWLDITGSPLTDAGKVIERFRRPTFGRMEIDVTIEDKKAYKEPFTVRVNQSLMLDEELIEFVCLENQRFGPEPGAPKK
jgi:hypothetical protein